MHAHCLHFSDVPIQIAIIYLTIRKRRRKVWNVHSAKSKLISKFKLLRLKVQKIYIEQQLNAWIEISYRMRQKHLLKALICSIRSQHHRTATHISRRNRYVFVYRTLATFKSQIRNNIEVIHGRRIVAAQVWSHFRVNSRIVWDL